MSLIDQLGTRGPCDNDPALGHAVLKELKADPSYTELFSCVELRDEALSRVGRLPFYKRYVLVELPVSRGREAELAFALHIPKSHRAQDDGAPSTIWLNGESGGIYRANDAEALDLAEEHVLDYLRFFVNFLRDEIAAFTLLDAKELVVPAEWDMNATEQSDMIAFQQWDPTATERFEFLATRERFMSGRIANKRSIRVIESGYVVVLPIAYGTDLCDLASFTITKNGDGGGERGEVEMSSEGQGRTVGLLSVRAIPELRQISSSVLQALRAIPSADQNDPGALARRLAAANKLGEAGTSLEDSEVAAEYFDEAIELLRVILADYLRFFGPDHPDTVIARTYLEYWRAWRNWGSGYSEKALSEMRRLLSTQMRSLGPKHLRTLKTRRNIALMLTQNDGRLLEGVEHSGEHWNSTRHALAIVALDGLIADIRENLAEDPPGESSQRDQLEEILVDAQWALAIAHHEMYTHSETENDEAAIEVLKALLTTPTSASPAVTNIVAQARYWLAEYLFGADNFDEAIAELDGLIADIRQHLSQDPPAESSQRDELEKLLVETQLSLALKHHELYKHGKADNDEAAIEILRKLLASPASSTPAVTKVLSDARYWLAEYLFESGDFDEAIGESQRRLAELRATDNPDQSEVRFSEQQLVRFEDGGASAKK